MNEYTYILAPNTAGNYAVLSQALTLYPDIVQESREKTVYRKSSKDVINSEGGLLVAEDSTQYIYLKALTDELNEALLAEVAGYQLYTVDSQPFDEFWL